MIVRLRDSYTTATDPVLLTVIAGEGQKAFIEARMDGNVITSGSGIVAFPLGNGPDIAGKKLRIATTVTDTNAGTNDTDVTYTLTGGAAAKSVMSSHTVDNPGETVFYDAAFTLL